MLNDEEFAKQLQAGMADLLGELEKSVSYDEADSSNPPPELPRSLGIPRDERTRRKLTESKQPDMQAQFEDMFKQLSATAAETAAAADAGPSPEAAREAADDASFQETIRRTMERMQGRRATRPRPRRPPPPPRLRTT